MPTRKAHSSRLVRTQACTLGLIASALSATALAQDNEGRGTTLDPIQVEARDASAAGPVDGYIAERSETGTKTDVPLTETPQSITVISREQMADRGANSLTDAVSYAPGINVDNSAAQRVIDSFAIDIRGFSAQDATFRDGTQMQAGLPYDAPVEPYGLERIEILRGPASVLYGQGQPGGIINLVTKRPTDEPLREIGAEYGSHDHRQLTADVSDALDEDGEWRYRFTGLLREADTHIDYVNNDRVYLAPALTWSPSARTSLTFLAHYQNNETRYPWSAFPRVGTREDGPHGTIPDNRYIGEPSFDRYDSTERAVGYILKHDFAERWTFRQNVRYRQVEYDVLDTFRNYFGPYIDDELRNLIKRYNRARFDEGETTTVDNRLISDWRHGDVEHTLLLGVDYKTLTYDRRDSGFVPITGPGSSLDLFDPEYGKPFSTPVEFTETTTEATQTGIYVQDHINVGERWVFSLGGRHDRVSSERTGEDERDQSETSYRAGAVYLADGGWAPYLSYSESFTPEYGSNPLTGGSYDPVTGKQYEIGVRYRPPSLDLAATAAVFDITRENEVVQNPDNPDNPQDQVQVGETESTGFELSLLADLTTNLQASVSYTRQAVTVGEAGGSGATNGNDLTDKPKHLARAWLDYAFGDGPLQGLGIGSGVRYTGESYADGANTVKRPSATLVDAAIRYAVTPGLRLQLTATNLLDEQPIYCSGKSPTATCDYGLPRQATLSATYHW